MSQTSLFYGKNTPCDIIPQGKHLAMTFNGKRVSPEHYLVVAHLPSGPTLQCVKRSNIRQEKTGYIHGK